jgi:hypothetical protein
MRIAVLKTVRSLSTSELMSGVYNETSDSAVKIGKMGVGSFLSGTG